MQDSCSEQARGFGLWHAIRTRLTRNRSDPMKHRALVSSALIGSLSLAPLCGVAGCSNLPGDAKTQGAVIGGVGGALAGAAIGAAGKNNAGIGALIGAAAGAGGGYLIGAQKDKLDKKKRDEAMAAHRKAEQKPATPADVEKARTADLNDDGFVTLDEVVAMKRANLSDREMIERLERTGQVFELTEEQERYLEDRGVSHAVIVEMRRMNPDNADYARTASGNEVIGDAPRQARRDISQSGRDSNGRRVPREQQPRDFERFRQGGVASSGGGGNF
jgi:hypothetical protein